MTTESKYIVLFGEPVTEDQIAQCIKDLESLGGVVLERYTLIKGFSATIPPDHVNDFQSAQGDIIQSIQPDGTVTIQQPNEH
ncbi:hypothetical protein SERLA73DRAFT_122333 [Serpula lacrymans var. lacrymans S7.3]|uniref:Inhibitor I9 domain-containing protein n=2 Tax=Serpula lacrymans var. lacrymans TaxID=341189 RepID=F8PWH3_SERL3|nr:uncharacterized protein SERLADRAFT_369213 [Serpula lacrymans var. lacrymans S7.9]EGO00297.1 hypothetical protein SERLA73DRAFT_122333 [Serpula lacrymans var. lacrymans S7.3]EGO25857.1 hypothetical protein SERLADRAFT_369213 [Serpula lacrymans var. lacrymans S7.9]